MSKGAAPTQHLGHQAYLRSSPDYDFLRYRQLVHEITVAFNGISQEILQIKNNLEGPLGRRDLAEHLGQIQEKEQEKLELVLGSCCPNFYALLERLSQKWVKMVKTAQLQLAKQNLQDQPGVEAHRQEVQELKHKLIQTIEAISEILQDFKYDSEESS
ncbi:hypothetical protein Chor_017225 [Crotalus horridus]